MSNIIPGRILSGRSNSFAGFILEVEADMGFAIGEQVYISRTDSPEIPVGSAVVDSNVAYQACKIGRIDRDEPSEGEVALMKRRLEWFAAHGTEPTPESVQIAPKNYAYHKPDGYHYRYATGNGTVIRKNDGAEVNGSAPVASIPYCYCHACAMDATEAPAGWKLVPLEPTAEILGEAAAAVWPVASDEDIKLAAKAALIVLKTSLVPLPGVTLMEVAATIATMAPAYRAMVLAAPSYPCAGEPAA